MNILSFTDAEKYLMNRQVYFRTEIANVDLKTIAKAGRVHDVGRVEIKRLSNMISSRCVRPSKYTAARIFYPYSSPWLTATSTK